MPTLAPINRIRRRVDSRRTNSPLKSRRGGRSRRHEIVAITVALGDYEKVKAGGGPHAHDISRALRRYVDLTRETDWRPKEQSFG